MLRLFTGVIGVLGVIGAFFTGVVFAYDGTGNSVFSVDVFLNGLAQKQNPDYPLKAFVSHKENTGLLALRPQFNLNDSLVVGDFFIAAQHSSYKQSDGKKSQESDYNIFANELYGRLPVLDGGLEFTLGKRIVNISESLHSQSLGLLALRESHYSRASLVDRGENMFSISYLPSPDITFDVYGLLRTNKDEYSDEQKGRVEALAIGRFFFSSLELKLLAYKHTDISSSFGAEGVYVWYDLNLKTYANTIYYSGYNDKSVSVPQVEEKSFANGTLGVSYTPSQYHQITLETWKENNNSNKDYHDFYALDYRYDTLDGVAVHAFSRSTFRKSSHIFSLMAELTYSDFIFSAGVRQYGGTDGGLFASAPNERQFFMQIEGEVFRY